jgi:hypothetical protein
MARNDGRCGDGLVQQEPVGTGDRGGTVGSWLVGAGPQAKNDAGLNC